MIVRNNGIAAYQQAMMQNQQRIKSQVSQSLDSGTKVQESTFGDTIKESLKSVNDMQTEKRQMVESFAAGENTNVHELMIQLQKAGMAMSVTSAVRGKVMQAYQELLKMQF